MAKLNYEVSLIGSLDFSEHIGEELLHEVIETLIARAADNGTITYGLGSAQIRTVGAIVSFTDEAGTPMECYDGSENYHSYAIESARDATGRLVTYMPNDRSKGFFHYVMKLINVRLLNERKK